MMPYSVALASIPNEVPLVSYFLVRSYPSAIGSVLLLVVSDEPTLLCKRFGLPFSSVDRVVSNNLMVSVRSWCPRVLRNQRDPKRRVCHNLRRFPGASASSGPSSGPSGGAPSSGSTCPREKSPEVSRWLFCASRDAWTSDVDQDFLSRWQIE